MKGPEPLPSVIKRVEAAIVESVDHPPSPEYGMALVKISDLRRLLTELERAAAQPDTRSL